MPDNMIIQPPRADIRRLAAIFLVTVVSLSLSVWMGLRLPTDGGGGIVVCSSPFDDGFAEGAVKLCLGEIIPIAVFSFACGHVFRTLFAAAVFCIRGAALGASVMLCVENTASTALLGVIVSYAVITLLTAVYFVLTSWKNELSAAGRLLIYMTASGAVAVIRIVPYLLLK